jgi:hypothetical protein
MALVIGSFKYWLIASARGRLEFPASSFMPRASFASAMLARPIPYESLVKLGWFYQAARAR